MNKKINHLVDDLIDSFVKVGATITIGSLIFLIFQNKSIVFYTNNTIRVMARLKYFKILN